MSNIHFNSILFLCTSSTRSQIAEGLARDIWGDTVRIYSASLATSQLSPYALQVMLELGIDLLNHDQMLLKDIDASNFDLVITLCPEVMCPAPALSTSHMHWPIQDPQGQTNDLTNEDRLAHYRTLRDRLKGRLEVLAALRNLPEGPQAQEFHASIRVPDLPAAARFYSWLLGVAPKEWTHRYVTFVSKALRTNFVLLVDDGKELHQDTLYHLGIDAGTKQAVITSHHQALTAGWTIHKPARTTWRGTPLHELWLKDPGGNLVEIYARLTAQELTEMPVDKEPTHLIERPTLP